MPTTNKIFIQVGEEVSELTGEAKEAFIADTKEMNARIALLEAETAKKQADRESAMAKLSKLGLTEDEIASLIP